MKTVRPRIPMAVLVPVAFAPDWIEWFLQFRPASARMESHGLISIAIGAAVTAIVYWLGSRNPGDALAIALLYVSHWFADLITGLKPTWPGGPDVGLILYNHPVADVVVESLVILVAAWRYQSMLVRATPARRYLASALIGGGLIGMQIGFVLIQNPAVKDPLHQIIDSTPLGDLSARSEYDILVPGADDGVFRMPLARLAREPDSSESWQMTEAPPVS
jgi:hypothetical protein